MPDIVVYYLIFYKLSNFLHQIFSLASIPMCVMIDDGLNTENYRKIPTKSRFALLMYNYNDSFQTMRFLRFSLLLILFISSDITISRAGEKEFGKCVVLYFL